MVNSGDFAKRLQKILDYYGLSATAFSEEIDFNRSTISHLLSGRNKPSLEFVMKVLQKFPEVELYWLLNGTGIFPSEKKVESYEKNPSAKKSKEKTSTLFPNLEEIKSTKQNITAIDTNISLQEIERIIIFYKDGSFKAYEN